MKSRTNYGGSEEGKNFDFSALAISRLKKKPKEQGLKIFATQQAKDAAVKKEQEKQKEADSLGSKQEPKMEEANNSESVEMEALF